ncbi:MAG TPA: tetratricopeptide repeat protein [Acidobacteriaceae bacterium]|nr:tetratricopeptide repeat protein [Acidobacteriaceae bacterium]
MAQEAPAPAIRLELAARPGLLTVDAARFATLEVAASPSGSQFSIRGEDQQDAIDLLAVLFQEVGEGALTSETCRDAVLGRAAADGPLLQVQSRITLAEAGQSLAVAAYTTSDAKGTEFYVRAFAARGDLCADLRFSSANPISAGTQAVREALASVRFDPEAKPSIEGVFRYARVVFENGMPDEAAPLYEEAVMLAPDGAANVKWRRITNDQAVTAYGMAGNWAKVRALLERAIAADPKYALNYYNLACADAEAGKAADAKAHLEEAFDQRANTLPGEPLPDPTQDASLLKLRGDAAFWMFVEGLEKGRGDGF